MTDSANRETLQAYESRADVYRDIMSPPQAGWLLGLLQRITAALPPGARVLEIGSGTGANARLLAAMGLDVQATDATRAFVEMMRADGLDATELNALTDDLPDDMAGPWDAIVAFAVFLHFLPDELAAVLAKVRHGIRTGGLLAFTVKEGEGSGWSEHKFGVPRHFTYWRAEALRAFLEARGWEVESLECEQGRTDRWLLVLARPHPAGSAIVP